MRGGGSLHGMRNGEEAVGKGDVMGNGHCGCGFGRLVIISVLS